jgi:protein-arginine kinase activator protein McsA
VEQLTDAIAAEQYELAAKLRDEIAQRQTGK